MRTWPYHPQTCGKVGRFHKTLKRWLARQPPAATLAALQDQLDHFRDYYNRQRPHRAVGRRTPEQAYAARPKAAPAGIPLDDAHWRIRHDIIDRYASSRFATTAGSTTSASADATPANPSSS